MSAVDPIAEQHSALPWEIKAPRELWWAALMAAGVAVRASWWLAKVFAVGAVLAVVVSVGAYLYDRLKRQGLRNAGRRSTA
jgi:hypothetical protein